MKTQHTIVLMLLALSLILLQFSVCISPARPEPPPFLRNDRNIKTEGILLFTLIEGKPDNDLINNGIYEFQSNPKDTSGYNVSISASYGNVISIGVINVMVIHDSTTENNYDSTMKDKEGPEIILTDPLKDNATVGTSSVTVTITCTDKSGVGSVTCTFYGQPLEVTKTGIDNYSGDVETIYPANLAMEQLQIV